MSSYVGMGRRFVVYSSGQTRGGSFLPPPTPLFSWKIFPQCDNLELRYKICSHYFSFCSRSFLIRKLTASCFVSQKSSEYDQNSI